MSNHWPVVYLYGFAYSKLSYLESASIKHFNLAFNRHSAFEVHSRGYVSFFLLMTNNPLYGCTSLSMPQVKKFGGCFYYWAIMNNAAVNIHMQVFLWMKFSFHLSKYLGVKLLVVGQSVFNFIKNCQTVFQNDDHLTKNVVSVALHHQHLVVSFFFLSHSNIGV